MSKYGVLLAPEGFTVNAIIVIAGSSPSQRHMPTFHFALSVLRRINAFRRIGGSGRRCVCARNGLKLPSVMFLPQPDSYKDWME